MKTEVIRNPNSDILTLRVDNDTPESNYVTEIALMSII